MDGHLKAKKKRYRILFFIFRRNKELDNETERTDNKWNTNTTPYGTKRFRYCVFVALVAFILSLVVIYKRGNIHIPSNLADYFMRQRNISAPEVRHVGYLKVHKAGSSTVQNILFRFGLKRNLSFVMPKTEYKLSDYNKQPNDLLDYPHGRYYDILAIHSVFDPTLYSQLLPRDTVNIAIIRNPLELMVSAAYYYRDIEKMDYLEQVPKEQYIRNLILYPELYDQRKLSWTRNSMAMDFGFTSEIHVDDTRRVNNYLDYLNEQFPLVMIMERFDESLILFKRLLHWSLEDILYIPVNKNKHPATTEVNLTESDVRNFELRNFLDISIYKYFFGVFAEKIRNAGDLFLEEVTVFQSILADVAEFCFRHRKNSQSSHRSQHVVEKTRFNARFIVTFAKCNLMLMKELPFIDLLRERLKNR